MANTFKGIVRDLSGRGGHATRGRITEGKEVYESPVDGKAGADVSEKDPSM